MFPKLEPKFDPADSLSVTQVQQNIQNAIAPCTDSESVSLADSLGRILATDIRATIDLPPFDNSAMDGYAFSFSDLPSKTTLQVVGSSFAGRPFEGSLRPGQAIRIMTGAMLPPGADCVLPQEHARLKDPQTLDMRGSSVQPGQNCRLQGEDLTLGKIALTAGTRLGAAELGLLAAFGLTRVSVSRRLRVAIFSTGDELRSGGQPLNPGGIYDSNRVALAAMLTRYGAQVLDLGILQDDPAMIELALQHAAGEVDVIVTSGGVSAGAADYVRQVLAQRGSVQFWRVDMRPGRPLAFGHVSDKDRKVWVFGLPGNPVAMMVGFYFFLRPALQRLSGERIEPPLVMKAVASQAMSKKVGRTEFQRGTCRMSPSGNVVVSVTGDQGSAMMSSMTRANCLIMLTPDQADIDAGEIVSVLPFEGLL